MINHISTIMKYYCELVDIPSYTYCKKYEYENSNSMILYSTDEFPYTLPGNMERIYGNNEILEIRFFKELQPFHFNFKTYSFHTKTYKFQMMYELANDFESYLTASDEYILSYNVF